MKDRRDFETPFYLALSILIGVIGAAVRIRAAFNDLWMDEIWSVELVRELHSAVGVFTQTHHDNNHYLNSLFIYFFGQRGNWAGYRLPAEVFGIGTIVLAWFIGARRDQWTAFFSMFLISFSYVMILYSSEARGYAPLIFCCFLCFLVLNSFFDRPRWQSAALFSISAVLGLTSHLTFLIFLCASLPWFWVRLQKLRWPIPRIAAWTTACYSAPFVYFVALYFVDLRYLQIGGGTPITVIDGYGATLAWALGGPNASRWQWFTGAISVLGLVAGLVLLIKDRLDEWVLFVGVVVVMPLTMPLFEHGTLHYVRYFIVALGFLLLLLGCVLGWLFQSGRSGKIGCALLCALFLILNGSALASLLKYGRSHIAEAIQFMDQNANQQPVTFGGQQDFRIQFVLSIYWRDMMDGKSAGYYEHDNWPTEGPEWVIFHKESFTQPVPPGSRFTDKFGNWFELVRIFPTAPLSGVHWFLYRKVPRPSGN